jgi:hypothetical protein
MRGIGLRSFGSVLALLCWLGLGCGGDDGGGGVSTGLPQDQKLSELDEDELMTACEAVSDSLENVISDEESQRIDCTAASIAGSVVMVNGKPQGDVAKCKQLVDECLAAGPDSSGNGSDDPIDTDLGAEDRDCTTDDTAEQFEGCSATVGEYESCLNAALAKINQLFSAIDCDALKDLEEVQDTFSGGFEIDSLPECKPIADKCPKINLSGDDEEEEPRQF